MFRREVGAFVPGNRVKHIGHGETLEQVLVLERFEHKASQIVLEIDGTGLRVAELDPDLAVSDVSCRRDGQHGSTP